MGLMTRPRLGGGISVTFSTLNLFSLISLLDWTTLPSHKLFGAIYKKRDCQTGLQKLDGVVPCELSKKMFGADQVGAVEEEEVDS